MGESLDDIINARTTSYLSYFSEEKESNKVIEALQKGWADFVKPSSEEEKNMIKSVTEQYVGGYVILKKTMESTYSKDIMDYYFERNKPTDKTKPDEYEKYKRARETLFQTDPIYKQTKTDLDIKFLQLRNNSLKELSSKIGEEKANRLINREPVVITHFPYLE
ncbi:MAG: hypothetical protein V1709_08860 [Planctomycetota bacterium]